MDRALALVSLLFCVETAALVLAAPGGLAVVGASGAPADASRDVACRLFEVLAASGADAGAAGALEELSPGRGFAAAAPVMSAGGRCLGALCLLDPDRVGLLSDFQRRLLAEVGGLLASRLDASHPALPPAPAPPPDAEHDAFALFDHDGRCLLRNGRFEALLGAASPGVASASLEGRDAGWVAARLMRDRAPVGVYRAALADGTWLSVEERRGPHGRSLVARVEGGDGLGDPDAQLLFERCPLAMFVFDRDTRGILAANAAALSLYGWDRGAFLGLPVDAIGPVPRRDGAGAPWTHRTRDGRALAVTGRATALVHRGRPAVLVTVSVPALVRAA